MALGLGVREGLGLGLGLGSGEHGLRAEEAREHLPISLYLPISPYISLYLPIGVLRAE